MNINRVIYTFVLDISKVDVSFAKIYIKSFLTGFYNMFLDTKPKSQRGLCVCVYSGLRL